jgi:hypothetical protein
LPAEALFADTKDGKRFELSGVTRKEGEMFMIFDSLDYIGLEAPSPYFCLGPAEFCVGVLSQGAEWQARRTRCLSTATPPTS